MRPRDNSWARVLWDFDAEPDPHLHDLENNLNLLRAIPGIDDSIIAAGLDLRSAFGLRSEMETRKRVLGVHPTASSPVKYYPLPFWHELLTKLAGEFDSIEIFCGPNPTEVNFCQQIEAALPAELQSRTQIFSGLPFENLVQKIDRTSYFIGSDSALMHLAALIDKPVLGLWSFANYRLIYPYGNHASVYLPEETMSAIQHEYPRTTPPYMDRANASDVFRIVTTNAIASDFSVKPKQKKAVSFFKF